MDKELKGENAMNDYSQERFWTDLKSGKFASMVKESSKGRQLKNAKEVYSVLKPIMEEFSDVEQVYAVFLDVKNRIVSIELLSRGTISHAPFYMREIIKRIIQTKATGFILAHNHPSGDIRPTPEDKVMTVIAGIASSCIDVRLHDHIIVGDGYYSLQEAGWIDMIPVRYKDLITIKVTD